MAGKKALESLVDVVSRLGFDPSTLALKGRYNTLSVVGCFSVWLYFKGFFDVTFCSFFLCFVFSLQQNCNGELDQGLFRVIYHRRMPDINNGFFVRGSHSGTYSRIGLF